MGMLDHWHPVHPSRELKKKPVEVKLAGKTICLYRTEAGVAAALDNVCPHRRLKLTYGTVVGDRLQCKYHGWTFDPNGNGESPSSPKMHTCTESYEIREAHNYVWLKSRASNPEFPEINKDNYYALGTFSHVIPAPLELTVDNFNEIEHSGTVHDTFGYDLEHLHEVRVRFEATDTSVRVINVGPTKKINPIFAFLLGIRKGDLFHDDWTTRFSPVYSVFDHWWTSPDETREAMVRWRIYIFFSPIDKDNTTATSFAFGKSRYPGPSGGLRQFKRLFRWEIDREIRQDISMLEHMADKSISIDGMKLSRFDRVLGMTRERIAKIYRGEQPQPAGRIEVA
ncbi:Rieske 2Fe-2S domain-containing protein [Fimbriiglobus ruber]|uniref:C3: similar to Vanillate O-demethylase oxygenase n=1 Tax=Fimbriiglobus ruber TaxID=1908690 RepID=A0A225DGC7_9BACT|nr:Rieske 2Fe-2S domain-containing protein [Fimbriiglobus ruber]OWK35137.1 C3: similar to Vanillate O-demethylase oxygenase [Fimbriiglobus ruber]